MLLGKLLELIVKVSPGIWRVHLQLVQLEMGLQQFKVGKSDANKIVRVSEEKIRSEIFMRNVYICELARS